MKKAGKYIHLLTLHLPAHMVIMLLFFQKDQIKSWSELYLTSRSSSSSSSSSSLPRLFLLSLLPFYNPTSTDNSLSFPITISLAYRAEKSWSLKRRCPRVVVQIVRCNSTLSNRMRKQGLLNLQVINAVDKYQENGFHEKNLFTLKHV